MTFDWLKTLLGDAYTEDTDKAVAAEIGIYPSGRTGSF